MDVDDHQALNASEPAGAASDDAEAALSAAASSGEAARQVARPPYWFTGGLGVCVGLLIFVSGWGQRWQSLQAALIVLVLVAEIAILVVRRRTKRAVAPLFAPFRGHHPGKMIALLVLWVMVVAAVVIIVGVRSVQVAVPLWGFLVAGLVLGGGLFGVTNWAWGSWVKGADSQE